MNHPIKDTVVPVNHVKAIREAQGINQLKLAGLTGIQPTRIGQVERMLVRINQTTARRLAAALGKQPSEVFPSFEQMKEG